ncbi:PilT/PilU family type 4a pilus ATPase [Pseudogulbenkiania ferrooxidans]|uniref:Twitching motility protein n=1 Tax=Pseudogulbenkiania ferrooxidans 2002 TaxID=279714 RepID=B9Z532_9NEIS|nr:PilT/PilU family type 4a pilus ATPase [Pseudogulbenkiania ferrooxidans]EEG08264.1 twitching motility protein [Pseudogulbenkiania ferrooxidans 2002]
MLLLPFFKLMADKSASDIFFTAHAPAQIKIEGVTLPVNDKALTPEQVKTLVYSLMDEEEIAEYEREFEMNFARQVDDLGNFRVNIFRQKGQPAMVIRRIAPTIPSLEKLNLPAMLKPLIMEKRGLIIVVGATGSGKSSTVAALLEHRNQSKSGHILTVEDPIEFLFEHRKSIVNQREIGIDTKSYQTALKNAMREAPEVLMIGEIRDAETLMYAINYAQSGHLCITTLHANNSYHMLNRVISFFPPDNRTALLMDLSVSLKAVVSQRLVPTVDKTLTPAVELLLNTTHIAELIRTGEISSIKEAIEHSMSEGAQTFEQSLFRLYRDGKITLDEALRNADSPTNLYWLINHGHDKPGEEPAGKPAAAKPAGKDASASFDGFTLDV